MNQTSVISLRRNNLTGALQSIMARLCVGGLSCSAELMINIL